MAGFSDYLELEILDHIFGGADWSRPATLYLALCTTAPTDASTGSTIVEPSGGGYARAAITNNATNFPAASSGSKANGTVVEFAAATGNWTAVTHWAICDAATAGNVLVWGALTASKTILTDDVARVGVGSLSVTLD